MAEQSSIVPVQYSEIEAVKHLANIVLALRKEVFKQGVDYGTIPGTGDKPTLLLPGMEKLLRGLRLRPEYRPLSIIEDFDKPLFVYRYECTLYEQDSGVAVSSAIGSANSYESKWRWRKADRVCPHCGKSTIIKGRQDYGGGWLCYAKKGGCGAKFADGDKSIEGQETGRVENTDIFDQINTIDKIAQKRALSSAIKGAANVSEFYTVDLEDLHPHELRAAINNDDVVEGEFTEEDTPPPAKPRIADKPAEPKATEPRIVEKPAQPKAQKTDSTGPQWNPTEVFTAVSGLFNSSQHRQNAIQKMKQEGLIRDDMTTADVIAAIEFKYNPEMFKGDATG